MKAATYLFHFDFLRIFISIHAAREGGDDSKPIQKRADFISIHAAREGGDPVRQVLAHKKDISIHAAREGGDCGNE